MVPSEVTCITTDLQSSPAKPFVADVLGRYHDPALLASSMLIATGPEFPLKNVSIWKLSLQMFEPDSSIVTSSSFEMKEGAHDSPMPTHES